ANDDRIDGNRGRDTLIGGSGRDRLNGGPGADVLRAADGFVDRVIGAQSLDDQAEVDDEDVVERVEILI
ncbi:MAG TPA: hypothetical protein PK402_13600, partial [Tepidisphaeraceae bacterium]|nr:hypothetical protein [Tepidisphaeraceae bacterium]